MDVSERGDGRGKMASLRMGRVEVSERGMGEVRWPPLGWSCQKRGAGIGKMASLMVGRVELSERGDGRGKMASLRAKWEGVDVSRGDGKGEMASLRGGGGWRCQKGGRMGEVRWPP